MGEVAGFGDGEVGRVYDLDFGDVDGDDYLAVGDGGVAIRE